MPTSTAIIVLGMHRSGTSVLTRGLQAMGVYLGDDFLSAQPANPTGYWENAGIVDLNDRLLGVLGLSWQSTSLIDDAAWQKPEVQGLAREAAVYLKAHFMQKPLWGFKDPRTVRLLPFWRTLLQRLGVDHRYLVVIRHPLEIALSLLKRENMPADTSHALTLAYLTPYLHEIADRLFIVADYDLFLTNPLAQMTRMAGSLDMPIRDAAGIESFCRDFLDPTLRHGRFSRDNTDGVPILSPLVREAYRLLCKLAADKFAPGSREFWDEWKLLRETIQGLILFRVGPDGRISGRENRAGVVSDLTQRP